MKQRITSCSRTESLGQSGQAAVQFAVLMSGVILSAIIGYQQYWDPISTSLRERAQQAWTMSALPAMGASVTRLNVDGSRSLTVPFFQAQARQRLRQHLQTNQMPDQATTCIHSMFVNLDTNGDGNCDGSDVPSAAVLQLDPDNFDPLCAAPIPPTRCYDAAEGLAVSARCDREFRREYLFCVLVFNESNQIVRESVIPWVPMM